MCLRWRQEWNRRGSYQLSRQASPQASTVLQESLYFLKPPLSSHTLNITFSSLFCPPRPLSIGYRIFTLHFLFLHLWICVVSIHQTSSRAHYLWPGARTGHRQLNIMRLNYKKINLYIALLYWNSKEMQYHWRISTFFYLSSVQQHFCLHWCCWCSFFSVFVFVFVCFKKCNKEQLAQHWHRQQKCNLNERTFFLCVSIYLSERMHIVSIYNSPFTSPQAGGLRSCEN